MREEISTLCNACITPWSIEIRWPRKRWGHVARDWLNWAYCSCFSKSLLPEVINTCINPEPLQCHFDKKSFSANLFFFIFWGQIVTAGDISNIIYNFYHWASFTWLHFDYILMFTHLRYKGRINNLLDKKTNKN